MESKELYNKSKDDLKENESFKDGITMNQSQNISKDKDDSRSINSKQTE